jgi:tRNA A-37 threonylcarbamoyl transferase component Bud32
MSEDAQKSRRWQDGNTTFTLRTVGRNPPAPCVLLLASAEAINIEHWLRILPGKRLTGVGIWQGRRVLAKCFIARRGAERHWQRECTGAERLKRSGLATPSLLVAGPLADGGHCVLYDYLAEAQRPAVESVADLARVFTQCGRLHAAGLLQEDAHLDNFLLRGEEVYLIDADAIRPLRDVADGMHNLALLFAQLPPPIVVAQRDVLLAAYRAGNPQVVVDGVCLTVVIEQVRAVRLANHLGKCLRDCTQFQVRKTVTRYCAMVRAEADFLAPIVADPDRWLAAGTPLKRGRTATLARIEHADRSLVIKRYNIKGPGHALSRSWRPSRAWHSWREGWRLQFLGIATPRPLALIERRLGPLRSTAWLVTEFCPGASLAENLAAEVPPSAQEAEAIGQLFRQLLAARISHGDLKATNLLWHDGQIALIDLDAMRQHKTQTGFRRAWQKDRARFLANWPVGSHLRELFELCLPALPDQTLPERMSSIHEGSHKDMPK